MLLNVYNRYDVTFEKGEGTYIYDNKGNKYLDFVSGISVNCLGHSSPIIVEALTEQSKKLIHISNLYYSEPQLNLAKKYGVTALPTLLYFKDGKVKKNYVGVLSSEELLEASNENFK